MRAALILAVLVAAPGAIADDRRPEDRACGCVTGGRTVAVGTRHCVATAAGPRLATCILADNRADWLYSTEGCAYSGVTRQAPPPG